LFFNYHNDARSNKHKKVLYKLMPAVVVYGKLNKHCKCVVKILKLIIIIVKVHKVVHSMKYYKVITYIYIYIYIV